MKTVNGGHSINQQTYINFELFRFSCGSIWTNLNCGNEKCFSPSCKIRTEIFGLSTSKDDGMDSTKSDGGQHGHNGFRDERHVDQYPVTLLDTEIGQVTCQQWNLKRKVNY